MNKVIVIAGGSGLLGKEFAKTLYDDNNDVIVIDRNFDSNYTNYCNEIMTADITDEVLLRSVVNYIYMKYSKIDIMINAVAMNPTPKIGDGVFNDFENYPIAMFREAIDVNIVGAFIVSREIIKVMLKNDIDRFKNPEIGFRGTVIQIASDLGLIAPDHRIYNSSYKKPADYCISKAATIMLTKYIASYYGNIIKSVCLTPGSVYSGQYDELKENLEYRIPIKRLANKSEYNVAIKFLCSQDSDYMQGENLVMDGGRSIW